MPKVFISRNLNTKSKFRDLLEMKGWQIEDQSLVKFEKYPITDYLPQTKWIFFYSKNGVKYFLKQVNTDYLKNKKFACIGTGTEKALNKRGLSSSFTGQGAVKQMIEDFSNLVGNDAVLFPRALHSLKTIQRGIEDQCEVYDLPVYLNVPLENPKKSNADYLIFTSPMNAETYFKHYGIDSHQKLIAIGGSTGKKIMHLSKQKVYVSPKPDEDSLIRHLLLVADLV